MKIKNKTHWRTDQLRKLISAVAKRELADRPDVKKRLVITLVYSKQRYSGTASYNGSRMLLRVPSANVRAFDHVTFAWLVQHEMTHSRGLSHARFQKHVMHFTQRSCEENKWALDYPVEQQVRQQRVKLVVEPDGKTRPKTKREQNRDNVVRLHEHWLSKLKLAETKVKKYASARRRYERREEKLAAGSSV